MQTFNYTATYDSLPSEIKWALVYTEIDPQFLARVYNVDENLLWRYLEDVNIALREADAERQKELPEIKKQVQEFRDEFPLEFRKKLRIEHLTNSHKELTKLFHDGCMKYAQEKKRNKNVSPQHLEFMEKQLNKIQTDLKIIQGLKEGITEQEIVRAKQFPIEQLVEVKRNYALCPFHNEKTPSMYVKNNTYHCFGCGVHGDPIDLYRAIHNADFIQAVKALQ